MNKPSRKSKPKSRFQPAGGGIRWPHLIQGTLIKRYKRFLADVKLKNGHIVTAHCANTGSMTSCSEPGRPVFLSRADNPDRKLKYTWEMIKMPSSMVGVNTMVPNILVKTAIEAGLVKQLKGYATTRSEVKTGPGTRLDIVLEDNRLGLCFIEIKNCTLVEEGIASFPDAVTSRGLKHLEELAALVKQGHRGVIFYLVQRSDASLFRPADSIDPEYGKALRKVIKSGVEILVYDVKINQTRIDLNKQIPIKL